MDAKGRITNSSIQNSQVKTPPYHEVGLKLQQLNLNNNAVSFFLLSIFIHLKGFMLLTFSHSP